ncbi:ankyrin-1-like, partial [Malaya genurostris]|uniref:ankyrin-1-like n=1 Tax=Malaya genurostris TaxID=325434 RepID=UPI0026F3A036
NDDYNIHFTLKSAASKGHIETFKYLEKLGQKKNFHTYIGVATEKNHLKIVEYLWQNYREFTTTDDGITALHYAIEHGNMGSIEYLCDNGANVKNAAKDDSTPLHYAAKEKRLDVIKYLVSKGANVNISDKGGMTVLDYAWKRSSTIRAVSFQKNELGTIKYLITECNANFGVRAPINIATARKIVHKTQDNVNIAEKNSETLLHIAVKSDELLSVRFLLKQGADVNARNNDGRTPLHLALESRFTDIARLLLQYGAMYDARDRNGKTPLDLFGNVLEFDYLFNVIDSLLNSKNLMQDLKNKLLKDKQHGGEWDSHAFDSGNPMIFIINARNAQGKTLLHVGADQNDFEAIKCLFEFNQDYLKIRDQLSHAKDYHSMDLTAKDSRGDTPLHRAALHGNREIVDLLLREGADFSVKNNEGYSPENLARNNNHNDVVELLQSTKDLFIAIEGSNILEVKNCISRGAYIDAKDKDGKTPLHWAARKNQEEIFNILLKNGATFTAEDIQDETPNEFEGKQSINLLDAINKTFNGVQRNDPESVLDYLQKIKHYNVDYLGVLINTCDKQGNTLLHYAVQEDYFDVIQFLLDNKAAFNVVNERNKTPRDLALHRDIFNLLEFIDRLFSNMRDAIEVHYKKKLIYSLKEIEEDPRKLKIITNVRDRSGETILHKNLNCYILKFLVRNGAEINAVDKYGKTPLHRAAYKGQLELVKLLIEHGANKNAIDDQGCTVLHEAVSSGQLDLITWLVGKQGANMYTKNKYGLPPIYFAKQKGHKVVELLLESSTIYRCSSKEIIDSKEPPIQRQDSESVSFLACSASGPSST